MIPKGTTKPVIIYEVYDADDDFTIEAKTKTLRPFEQGLEFSRSQKFEFATKLFSGVLKTNPFDKAAQVCLDRSNRHIKYGVPDDWTGIEVFTSK